MSIQVEFQAIAPPLRWDEAGGIRIGESRVTLDSLLAAYNTGSTPEEIALQYSVLTLAEIYGAITYYLNHRQQIDNYLEQRNQNAQQRRKRIAHEYNLVDFRQRLLTRYQAQINWLIERAPSDRWKLQRSHTARAYKLIRRIPGLDIVRVQDVGLRNADDPTILEWAANEERILLTHDVAFSSPSPKLGEGVGGWGLAGCGKVFWFVFTRETFHNQRYLLASLGFATLNPTCRGRLT